MISRRSLHPLLLPLLAVVFQCSNVWSMEATQEATIKPPSFSWGPLISYTPTYGVLLGGSLFQKSHSAPGIDFGLAALTTFKPNLAAEATFTYRADERMSYLFEGNLSTFFTSYYGEGDQTSPQDRVDLANTSVWIKAGPQVALAKRWSLWPYLIYRSRDEKSNEALLADKSSAGLALALKYTEVPQGRRFWQEHQLMVRALMDGFQQAELDLRAFWALTPEITFASRALGAVSVGAPNHLYRYSIGGSQYLRGFFENRFRGKHLAVVQEEMRVAIWKFISGALFIDAGDVSDSGFRSLKWSYGGGLRFGLPPDSIAKVRLDLGFSEDQSGVFFMFGEAF